MKRCWKCGSIMKEGTTYDGLKLEGLLSVLYATKRHTKGEIEIPKNLKF